MPDETTSTACGSRPGEGFHCARDSQSMPAPSRLPAPRDSVDNRPGRLGVEQSRAAAPVPDLSGPPRTSVVRRGDVGAHGVGRRSCAEQVGMTKADWDTIDFWSRGEPAAAPARATRGPPGYTCASAGGAPRCSATWSAAAFSSISRPSDFDHYADWDEMGPLAGRRDDSPRFSGSDQDEDPSEGQRQSVPNAPCKPGPGRTSARTSQASMHSGASERISVRASSESGEVMGVDTRC